jgi:hypothetical protein
MQKSFHLLALLTVVLVVPVLAQLQVVDANGKAVGDVVGGGQDGPAQVAFALTGDRYTIVPISAHEFLQGTLAYETTDCTGQAFLQMLVWGPFSTGVVNQQVLYVVPASAAVEAVTLQSFRFGSDCSLPKGPVTRDVFRANPEVDLSLSFMPPFSVVPKTKDDLPKKKK